MIFIQILAERENGFIYHQKIPDVLPELGEMKATHGLAAPDPYHIVEKRYVHFEILRSSITLFLIKYTVWMCRDFWSYF